MTICKLSFAQAAFVIRLGVIFVLPLWPTSTFATSAMSALSSHKAVYEMMLEKRTSKSKVYKVEGLLALRLSISCDTAATTQQLVLQYQFDEGPGLQYEERIQSVETLGDKSFAFSNMVKVNGQVDADVRGRVELTQKGQKVTLKSKGDEERSTLLATPLEFPIAQLAAALDAAKNGEQRYQSYLYDGSNKGDKVHDVVVWLAKQQDADPSHWPKDANSSAPEHVWPMQFTYFDAAKPDVIEPQSVVDVRFTDGGIATKLSLDFGEYTLGAKLLSVDVQSQSEC